MSVITTHFLFEYNIFAEYNNPTFRLQLYVNSLTNLSKFTYCTLDTVVFNDFLGLVQMHSLPFT